MIGQGGGVGIPYFWDTIESVTIPFYAAALAVFGLLVGVGVLAWAFRRVRRAARGA